MRTLLTSILGTAVGAAVAVGCSFTGGSASQATPDSPIAGSDAAATHDARVPDARGIDAPCADADHDGVCDSVDDWPCGPKPNAPSATVTIKGTGSKTQSISITGVDVDKLGLLAVVPPSTAISYQLTYSLQDTTCAQSCIDQIEVGFMTGPRLGCAMDANVPEDGTGSNGTTSGLTIMTPKTPGQYDLRFDIGQGDSCGTGSGWWDGANGPPASQTLATICVH